MRCERGVSLCFEEIRSSRQIADKKSASLTNVDSRISGSRRAIIDARCASVLANRILIYQLVPILIDSTSRTGTESYDMLV